LQRFGIAESRENREMAPRLRGRLQFSHVHLKGGLFQPIGDAKRSILYSREASWLATRTLTTPLFVLYPWLQRVGNYTFIDVRWDADVSAPQIKGILEHLRCPDVPLVSSHRQRRRVHELSTRHWGRLRVTASQNHGRS
jgi:hypothetical protein